MEGFNLAQKGRAGDAIIMRWTMTTMMMTKGGSKGKSINDSISEHKCIVTSNIIYSITVIIPINNREKLENIHLGSGTELENTIYICIPNTRCGISSYGCLDNGTWDNVPK